MPVSTRKANADVHPGRVVLNSQQTRRTKKQIEDDDAMDRSNKEKATEKYRAVVDRIAELEDKVAMTEVDMRSHALRPDLRVGAPRLPTLPKSMFGSHHKPSEASGEDDDAASDEDGPEGHPQTNEDAGSYAGNNDEGPGTLEDECDDDAGYTEDSVAPARPVTVKRKQVSLSLSIIISTDCPTERQKGEFQSRGKCGAQSYFWNPPETQDASWWNHLVCD